MAYGDVSEWTYYVRFLGNVMQLKMEKFARFYHSPLRRMNIMLEPGATKPILQCLTIGSKSTQRCIR